ncbi:MAG TPA: hypothetical protein DDZ43_17920 [Hyphomonadaceae bacterium]|nr:hypothetical protein [Hyphomonadaceae bacterium]
MEIERWTPNRPYLEAAEGMCADELYEVYLRERAEYGALPSYFLEFADLFEQCGDIRRATETALTALELSTSNHDTLTAVGQRLMRYGDIDRAVDLFRRVTEIDPSRPQPWRDLALALDASADLPGLNEAERRARLSEALEHLNHVISSPWSWYYDGIEGISVLEANRILDRLQTAGGNGELPSEALEGDMQVDLRIVVGWNVDEVDMDLWVTDPRGERVYYGNNLSAIGGRISNDMTDGYGPEEFMLRKAIPGVYTVEMDYFSSDIVNPNGAVAINAELWQNYGMPDERVQRVELEFDDVDQSEYLVATITVEGDD